jgi:hypothetical protein
MLHDGHLDGRASIVRYLKNITQGFVQLISQLSHIIFETEHEKRFVDSATNINFLERHIRNIKRKKTQLTVDTRHSLKLQSCFIHFVDF